MSDSITTPSPSSPGMAAGAYGTCPADPAVADSAFLRACRGEPGPVPMWLMRQAGRYLPAYREVRARFPNFLEFVATPEAAAEVTIQPVDLLGVDAAILFCDILVVLPPLGLELAFTEKAGPSLANPLRDEERIRALPRLRPAESLAYVAETVRLSKARLSGRAPLIGFAGAPWTVAAYAVEGGSTKDYLHLKGMLHREPAALARLLDHLAEATADYLCLQAEAGADALQIFESWGVALDPRTYRKHVLPSLRRLVQDVRSRTGRPVILYCNGSSTLADVLLEAGADVLGVDWRLPMEDFRARCGAIPLQGNLDPVALFGTPDSVRAAAAEVLEGASGGAHIFNLGHGILPATPIENVRALIETVHGANTRVVSRV